MTMRSTINKAFGVTLLAALFLAPLLGRSQEQISMSAGSSSGVSTDQLTYMTAMVTAVDQKARTVTLKGPEGNEMTLGVGDDVKRLDEIKAGDLLDVGYLESVGLEFREATEEEMKDPLKVTEEIEKAEKGDAPAGAKVITTRAVVTLEGMSRWMNTLTVRGPRGNYFIVDMGPDMVKWENLRIGQTMVGSYTEAVVMSIDPAVKKK